MSELLVKVLGVGISNITLESGLEEVTKWLINEEKKHYIVTPNPEFLVRAQKDREFFEILNKADLALPDGIGLIWASKILGRPLTERVAGVEFMLGLCKLAEERGLNIGLIGGGKGVAVGTKECLLKTYPKLLVVLSSEEWLDELSLRAKRGNLGIVPPQRDPANLAVASSSRRNVGTSRNDMIDILFVAFGAPKQEKWIAENLEKIPVRVAMGVGGSFDYIAGVVPRAPKIVRDLGFEWLFRLILQPWRAFRQLALLKFVVLVLREKFFK